MLKIGGSPEGERGKASPSFKGGMATYLLSISIQVNFLDSKAFIGCNAFIPIELIPDEVGIVYDLNSLLKYYNKNKKCRNYFFHLPNPILIISQ